MEPVKPQHRDAEAQKSAARKLRFSFAVRSYFVVSEPVELFLLAEPIEQLVEIISRFEIEKTLPLLLALMLPCALLDELPVEEPEEA